MQKSPILTLTQMATEAISAGTFVNFAGAPLGAGLKGIGVAVTDAAIGKAVAVDVIGTTIVLSGAAVAAGAPVKADATSRAIAQGGAGEILGYARQAASAAGQPIEILLTL